MIISPDISGDIEISYSTDSIRNMNSVSFYIIFFCLIFLKFFHMKIFFMNHKPIQYLGQSTVIEKFFN